ncbi:MAG: DMT family transporter [Burkholderiales bacterium]|nr:DMT family transporter [Burkholderiales bacterium]
MIQAVALAMLASALFGSALVTTYCGLRHMDVWSGARVSVPSAAVFFWLCAPFADWSGRHDGAAVIFLLVGLFFPAAVTFLAYEGNRRLGPNVAGAIGSTAPLFAVLGAALFLGERFGARELGATGGIVAGSALLTVRGGNVLARTTAAALWLPWAAALLRALAQVASKAGLTLWPSPFAAALAGYTVSAAVIWAVCAARRGTRFAANRRGAAWFAATGMLNGLAVLALYGALQGGPVHVVSPVVATYPLFTLMLTRVLPGPERVTGRAIAGVALIVAGVALLLAGA